MSKDNRWTKYTEQDLQELNALAEDYKKFLTESKTERACVKNIIARAEKADHSSGMNEVIVAGSINTAQAGEYMLTYRLDGESVILRVIVE